MEEEHAMAHNVAFLSPSSAAVTLVLVADLW